MSIVKGVALITGAAQGIGRSIALRLAQDGFDIGLNDLPSKRDQLHAIADNIKKSGRRICFVPGDVTSEEEVKGMVEDVSKELGGLDVVSVPPRSNAPLNAFLVDGGERGGWSICISNYQ